METVTQRVEAVETEAALLGRFRAGDTRAFDEVVARHRQAVYLTARRLLGSHEDADEAAQQAFVRAWRALDGFRGEASLRTWLIRIVLNVAKTMRCAPREVEGLDGREEPVDTSEGVDEKIRRRQVRSRVRQAVAELPPRQREVVVLKVFSEMTHREVAESMELSVGAVKAHLHQAVANLRRVRTTYCRRRTRSHTMPAGCHRRNPREHQDLRRRPGRHLSRMTHPGHRWQWTFAATGPRHCRATGWSLRPPRRR